MLDTSCACLMRLAAAVHEQGYKVALTGEGADEALAGYVWFKTQKIRDAVVGRIGPAVPRLVRKPGAGVDRRRPAARCPPSWPIRGVRTAQQDLYELIGQARPIALLARRCGTGWATTPPTTTWTSPTTGSAAGTR